jgi:hypothetical protein
LPWSQTTGAGSWRRLCEPEYDNGSPIFFDDAGADALTNPYGGRLDTIDSAHHANTFVEVDQCDVVIAAIFLLPTYDCGRVDASETGRLDPVQSTAVAAMRADEPRMENMPAARSAFLDAKLPSTEQSLIGLLRRSADSRLFGRMRL